jgi:hypothetical protein
VSRSTSGQILCYFYCFYFGDSYTVFGEILITYLAWA